ncbi:hypothetical protein R3P38DRAFT_65036 [Favolaschia claudopus]|uniref:Uncharacterized protein n=1 Tax=Favolaschia claudopus TaxID=2862362 RepID=A0AAW0EJB0_9AGAR
MALPLFSASTSKLKSAAAISSLLLSFYLTPVLIHSLFPPPTWAFLTLALVCTTLTNLLERGAAACALLFTLRTTWKKLRETYALCTRPPAPITMTPSAALEAGVLPTCDSTIPDLSREEQIAALIMHLVSLALLLPTYIFLLIKHNYATSRIDDDPLSLFLTALIFFLTGLPVLLGVVVGTAIWTRRPVRSVWAWAWACRDEGGGGEDEKDEVGADDVLQRQTVDDDKKPERDISPYATTDGKLVFEEA